MNVAERLTTYLAGTGRVEGVRSISNGWETEVYAFDLDGAPMVLRLYQGSEVEARAGNEFRMMRQLGQLGYPVPRVDRLETDRAVFGGPFLLMERVEGQPMAHLFASQPAEQLVERLCRLMVQLHSLHWQPFVGPEGVWPDLATARSAYDIAWVTGLLRLGDLLESAQPLIDWLEQRGRSVAFETTLLHGDFHFDNVLVRPDGAPAVIDWGITGMGDPRHDLAYTYILMTTQGHPRLGDAILQTYEALAGRQLADWDYFEAWALTRRLVIMLVVLVRGSAALGLRPGLEVMMRQNVDHIRMVAGLVSQRTRLNLPELEGLLR